MQIDYNIRELKVICLKEQHAPSAMALCDTAEKVADYFNLFCKKSGTFNADVENFTVLLLNTRRRVIGHVIISSGTLDTLLVHPREVFKAAILANAAAVILLHNHPSGDPMPSEADVKVTRDLIRAGQILKIEVLDHVVMGIKDEIANNKGYCSLREMGYFNS
jgi:DNA repair protein RadC